MTTNNRIDLSAIMEALRHAPSGVGLEIVTNNQNAIGWLTGGWDRKVLEIKAACEDIDSLLKARKCTLSYVKSRKGDPLNHRVLQLAMAAVPEVAGGS